MINMQNIISIKSHNRLKTPKNLKFAL